LPLPRSRSPASTSPLRAQPIRWTNVTSPDCCRWARSLSVSSKSGASSRSNSSSRHGVPLPCRRSTGSRSSGMDGIGTSLQKVIIRLRFVEHRARRGGRLARETHVRDVVGPRAAASSRWISSRRSVPIVGTARWHSSRPRSGAKPSDLARSSHSAWTVSAVSPWSFRRRVSSAAACAARAPRYPRSSISGRRRLNVRNTGRARPRCRCAAPTRARRSGAL